MLAAPRPVINDLLHSLSSLSASPSLARSLSHVSPLSNHDSVFYSLARLALPLDPGCGVCVLFVFVSFGANVNESNQSSCFHDTGRGGAHASLVHTCVRAASPYSLGRGYGGAPRADVSARVPGTIRSPLAASAPGRVVEGTGYGFATEHQDAADSEACLSPISKHRLAAARVTGTSWALTESLALTLTAHPVLGTASWVQTAPFVLNDTRGWRFRALLLFRCLRTRVYPTLALLSRAADYNAVLGPRGNETRRCCCSLPVVSCCRNGVDGVEMQCLTVRQSYPQVLWSSLWRVKGIRLADSIHAAMVVWELRPYRIDKKVEIVLVLCPQLSIRPTHYNRKVYVKCLQRRLTRYVSRVAIKEFRG